MPVFFVLLILLFVRWQNASIIIRNRLKIDSALIFIARVQYLIALNHLP